jgi:hypothetical protein
MSLGLPYKFLLAGVMKTTVQSIWAAITKWHKPDTKGNGNLYLILRGAGKSTIKALADLLCGEALLPHRQQFLALSSQGGRGQLALCGLSHKGTNLILTACHASEHHHLGA